MQKELNFSLRDSRQVRYQKANCERRSGGKKFRYLERKEQWRSEQNIKIQISIFFSQQGEDVHCEYCPRSPHFHICPSNDWLARS